MVHSNHGFAAGGDVKLVSAICASLVDPDVFDSSDFFDTVCDKDGDAGSLHRFHVHLSVTKVSGALSVLSTVSAAALEVKSWYGLAHSVANFATPALELEISFGLDLVAITAAHVD